MAAEKPPAETRGTSPEKKIRQKHVRHCPDFDRSMAQFSTIVTRDTGQLLGSGTSYRTELRRLPKPPTRPPVIVATTTRDATTRMHR